MWDFPKRIECRRLQTIKVLALSVLLPIISGCSTMGIQQQRLVSKPNMVFDSALGYRYDSLLVAQVEIGSAVSGGAQAAGCTACR